MNIALIFLIVYFVAMAGIGVWTMKRSSNNTEGYLLADRSIGPAVTALRLQSSSMSGYMFLGAGSLAYTQGYYSMWYALGDIGGGIINLSVLGRRMRKLSQKLGSLTSIEYLEHRYESKWVRLVAAPVALFCLFLYVLSQFIAGGSGLAVVTGLNFNVALLVAVGVIVLYTFLGGYLAVAYTDFVQAIIMVIGMVWILVATLQYLGGFSSANERIGEINPNLLTMWGANLEFQGQWGVIIGALLLFSIGYMGWPHVVVSHMAMKQPSVARSAGVYATLFNLFFIPAPYIIGIFALLVLPQLDDPQQAIFETAKTVLPSFAVGIVMAAVMAAIMSTADALLLQASTIAAKDIFGRFIIKDMTEKHMVWISRCAVLLLSFGGIVLAIWQPPAVFGLVVFATSILGGAFVPAYVCAVWWPKGNSVGATLSIILGTAGVVSWQVMDFATATGIDPLLAGLILSTAGMVFGSLATQKSHPVSLEVQQAISDAASVTPASRKAERSSDPTLINQFPGQGA
ncbi:sodium/proline symporter [Corynebacterium sp. 153RC1]|uniref:sodium/proline symporter n=1 Tax=unclassified Corynebacterium TaxID=2624378 RepID=UPI00211BF4D2|nr:MULTISPECIES: sodium/proline symporter [unclassified Corynebacterium]MCQ9370467.1 sodium/proline symporter [Corynebacterium sp. 35RC1]MCQ9352705.1 sodium/proline symporter [Corynebacterium sp. 209RC1]MCQ9354889.1 sodium/proline symporter [Corynebacterium sp. 1222RC1]MCQ9357074.1 sodium/proline symporter [Corynebacterium sp. 122RC1]MCQ9359320.1 sodium/proline symporter [Corynebacterium sp. 142RC1]